MRRGRCRRYRRTIRRHRRQLAHAPARSMRFRQPMSAPDGRATNALVRLRQHAHQARGGTFRPDGVDRARSTRASRSVRMEMLPQYKAQRPPTRPGCSHEQFPMVQRAARRASSVPVYAELEGWEGDDILGTHGAPAARRRAATMLLVTGDRDIVPAGERTTCSVVATKKGVTRRRRDNGPRHGGGALRRRHARAQYPTSTASRATPRTTSPACRASAPRRRPPSSCSTAALDEVIAHADEVKGKMGENLRAHIDDALVSRRVATIRTDAPIELDLADARFPTFDPTEVARAFSALGFTGMTSRLVRLAGEDAVAAARQALGERSEPARQRGAARPARRRRRARGARRGRAGRLGRRGARRRPRQRGALRPRARPVGLRRRAAPPSRGRRGRRGARTAPARGARGRRRRQGAHPRALPRRLLQARAPLPRRGRPRPYLRRLRGRLPARLRSRLLRTRGARRGVPRRDPSRRERRAPRGGARRGARAPARAGALRAHGARRRHGALPRHGDAPSAGARRDGARGPRRGHERPRRPVRRARRGDRGHGREDPRRRRGGLQHRLPAAALPRALRRARASHLRPQAHQARLLLHQREGPRRPGERAQNRGRGPGLPRAIQDRRAPTSTRSPRSWRATAASTPRSTRR